MNLQILTLFVLNSALCYAQNHDKHSLVYTIDYNSLAANAWLHSLSKKDSLIFTPTNSEPFPISSFNVTMSDSSGSFIFACNGEKVFNKDMEVMKYGDSINVKDEYNDFGNKSFVYNHINAVPLPGRTSEYVFFYNSIYDDVFGRLRRVIRYASIDTDNHEKIGIVVEKNILLDTMDLVPPVLCKHANGHDWWIISAEARDNIIYVYLLSDQGIVGPRVVKAGSDINQIFSKDKSYSFHYLLLTSDGTKLISQKPEGYLDVFDFDRCTGNITFSKSIKNFNTSDFRFSDEIIDACLSPNGKNLYFTTRNELYQTNLLSNNSVKLCHFYSSLNPFLVNLSDSKVLITSQIGSGSAPLLALISNPNLPGNNADVNLQIYNNFTFFSPYLNSLKLPKFPNYRLGKSSEFNEDACNFVNLSINVMDKEYFTLDGKTYFTLKRKYK